MSSIPGFFGDFWHFLNFAKPIIKNSATLNSDYLSRQEKHKPLTRTQSLVTELNTLGKQLQLTADTVTRDNIESSLVAVNKQWSDLADLANEQQCQLSVSIRPSIHLSILLVFMWILNSE